MTDLELVREFESCTLPPAAFTHERHLRVAWHYLGTEPLGHAAERFKKSLQRFAEANGAAGKYHETITWAYMVILSRMRKTIAGEDTRFDAAMERFPELRAHRGELITSIYKQEQLDSPDARAMFLLPGQF